MTLRRDRFEQLGLNRPISWADINQACDTIEAGGDPAFALVLPTVGNQNYVHQVFEQLAMSNNARPFDTAGAVTMNTPEMVEALRFYTALQRCSPPAPQNLYDARERFQRDEAATLFYSTYIKLASEYGVHPTQIHEWKRQLMKEGSQVYGRRTGAEEAAAKERENELYEQMALCAHFVNGG